MLKGYHRRDGVIRERRRQPNVRYDSAYVSLRYDQYPPMGPLSRLRLDLMCDVTEVVEGARILDVGYGNGDFLRTVAAAGFSAFGNDISGYPLPPDVSFVEDVLADTYDVITFFDSLEHMADIEFVGALRTRFVVVTVPWCHYVDDEWFRRWRHRRPGEHLLHFDDASLTSVFEARGFRRIYLGSPEDVVRLPDDHLPNTLTAVFKRAE